MIFLFVIDNMSGTPVYEQIIKQAENFILTDVWGSDAPVPSVRSVAVETSSNPNTVQKAYTQMLTMGILYSVPGKGSFVSADAKEKLKEKNMERLSCVESLSREFALSGIEKELVIGAVDRGYEIS